jgi:hypothetical protein
MLKLKKKERPNGHLEEQFLEKIPPMIGLTSSGTHTSDRFPTQGNIGNIPAPNIPVRFTLKQASQAKVRVYGETIIWTREQSRFIELLANYTTEHPAPNQQMTTKHAVPACSLHIHTLMRFGKKAGLGQNDVRLLRRFIPFWEAVNERKKQILGVERFHEVADAIFQSAISGSHADRKLYLEVFCKFQDNLKEKEPSAFEKLLMNELTRRKRIKKAKKRHKQDVVTKAKDVTGQDYI